MSKIPIPASLSLNFVHRRYFKRLMELKARVKRSMAANTTGTRSVAISKELDSKQYGAQELPMGEDHRIELPG
jgi:hypothetical protein